MVVFKEIDRKVPEKANKIKKGDNAELVSFNLDGAPENIQAVFQKKLLTSQIQIKTA